VGVLRSMSRLDPHRSASATAFLDFLLALCVLCASVVAFPVEARQNRLKDIPAAELPAEAVDTLGLIRKGGPFPYRKDGMIFGNFERRLPRQERGYYREYTVPTPGSRDRGARRIVAGEGDTGDVRTSGEYYYTDDHYRTFRRIRE
jgi:ribonuclease T1